MKNKEIENEQKAEPLTSNSNARFQIDDEGVKNYNKILAQQTTEKPFIITKVNHISAAIVKINRIRASAEEANNFQKFMDQNIDKGYSDFIIDFSNCEFMDSTFLGTVIVVTKKLNLEGGSLAMIANPKKLKVLHALSELNKILTLYTSIDDAAKDY